MARTEQKIMWKRAGQVPVVKDEIKDGVHLLKFPLFEEQSWLSHGFSTRMGGVSQGKYASMNLSFTKGDDRERVLENYQRMADMLGAERDRMVLSFQTHTTNVRRVTEQDAGKGIVKERDYTDVDGLITDVPGISLVTFYADCVPLYFADPVHHAIGLSHSGWRGTVNRMGEKTLKEMEHQFGTRAEEVLCAIGPSICQTCFEVGKEVVEAFQEKFDSVYWKELFYEKPNGKYQLDLWKANEIVLLEAGVKPEHIQVTDICTHCNPDYLFSHRTMGNERGNLAAFLMIR